MSRKGKKKPSDSRNRPRKISPPADGPNFRGNGSDRHSTNVEPSPFAGNRRAVLAVCGGLLLAVGLVFGQTVQYKFVNFDDDGYVTDNPHVQQGVSVSSIYWAFTNRDCSNWHPLTWLSHILDYQLYGLRAGGHHLTNVLLHAANAILLFLVLWRMTGNLWPSAFVAAVFAVHPLHVESVAWVAERKDVLSGLFFMLTLAAYLRYVRGGFSSVWYWTVAALFAFGLMAKPMLVTLPLVLLLLDYWPLGRMSAANPSTDAVGKSFSVRRLRDLIVEKIPLFLLMIASCVATPFAQGEAVAELANLPLSSRIANALMSYVAYLGQSFWPENLAVYYPHPGYYSHPGNDYSATAATASLLLLVGISAVAWIFRRKSPYLLVGWLWFLGILVPVIGLVQVGAHAKADRYMYLPQIGLCIAVAWGAERASRHWPYRRWVAGVTSALAVISLAWCAWQQVSYWKDSETLWLHTLACTSDNWLAHNNVGNALTDLGQVDAAIAHYQAVLKIKPDYAETHSNLGNVLAGRGQVDAAIAHYQTALKIKPDFAKAHVNLSIALVGRGRIDEAIVHYKKALEIKSDFVDAHYNLGAILAGRGQIDEAIIHYQKALELKPDYAKAHYNLGNALAGRGRIDEAIIHYQKALEIKPDYVNAHFNLGNALAGCGRIDAAIAHYQKALELKPDYANVHNNLGIVLVDRRRIDEAIAHYQKALKIKPDYAEAHFNLGNALAVRDRLDEAIAQFQKALEIKPGYVDARRNLEVALSNQKIFLTALAEQRKLLRSRPKDLTLLNDAAWLLATAPYASVRNGPEAVDLAQRAIKLSDGKNPVILDTLAAAYAEAGRFAEAVQTAPGHWTSPRNRTNRH